MGVWTVPTAMFSGLPPTVTVTSLFSVWMAVKPLHTRVNYNNDVTWFTPKLKWLRIKKNRHLGGKHLKMQNTGLGSYWMWVNNWETQLTTVSVWKGLQKITNHKLKLPHTLLTIHTWATILTEFFYLSKEQKAIFTFYFCIFLNTTLTHMTEVCQESKSHATRMGFLSTYKSVIFEWTC